ncbi:hypothetical protein B296_00050761 [Ensete ventricosum]|uniref:Uncharacterized protein n=1 Tax=Ensete ventricosum TaxID=4639 RepID=A0A426X751_ENSVE|nr:hypothetical protein B296_00050761 [Ensete ventricosum]
MPLLLFMSFCTLVFIRFSGLLLEIIKGIVFRANYALTDPTDFTQIWVTPPRAGDCRLVRVACLHRQLTMVWSVAGGQHRWLVMGCCPAGNHYHGQLAHEWPTTASPRAPCILTSPLRTSSSSATLARKLTFRNRPLQVFPPQRSVIFAC